MRELSCPPTLKNCTRLQNDSYDFVKGNRGWPGEGTSSHGCATGERNVCAVSTQVADLGSTGPALLLPLSHPTPCSLHFLGPSQVREHVNWAVGTQSEFVSQIPAQEDLGDIENILLAFTFSLVGLPWGLMFLYHHAEFRVLLMNSTPNWRVYWPVSQGNRWNVSTGSLLFKFIRISWSHDKNWVSREYDWESRILKTSLEDPPQDPLPCWPQTCAGRQSAL